MEVEAILSSSADSFIPISAWLIVLLNCGPVLGGSGLRITVLVSGSIVVKMHDLQVAELVKVGEEEIATL